MDIKKNLISFDMSTGTFELSKDFQYSINETADYVGFHLGSFFNPITFESINSSEAMELLCKEPDLFLSFIDGVYLVCIYNKRKNTLQVVPDVTSSSYPMYYTIHDGKVILSTYLRLLLQESGISRKINHKIIPSVFKNFCVMNNETLVENIYKICPGTYIEISMNGVVVNKHPGVKLNNLFEKEIDIETVLHTFINKQFNDEIHMALSSGYDSNMLLHCATKGLRKQVTTYTIGAQYGKTESNTVRKIVDNYNINSIFYDIGNAKDTLPDIIWRLEGAVFENGIILQYYLSKIAFENECKKILCGESADEVMFCNYNKLRNPFSMEEFSTYRVPFSSNPFLATNLIVLKKNGIMMNSFGIQPVYAYKTAQFISYAEKISHLNNNNKREFKRICSNCFDSNVKKLVASSGGATDPRSFINPEELIKLIDLIASKTWISDHVKWLHQEKHDIKKMLLSNSTEGFEMASDALTGLGMVLFERLFISREFDQLNNSNQCNLLLKDLIE